MISFVDTCLWQKTSKRMLMKKLQNHTIEIKKKFVLRKGKMYSLLREEREKVCEFIKEQLREEYIRLSKLSQIAPVFFIGKKNKKKYIVQDYQYLNEWTIKNNYPLLLILDIVENISTKKVFITPEGLFKPIVIFFGLTNLPAIFQTMMNEILQDLINTGEVVSLIDDIIVGTKKNRHDEAIEKVVKRLVENNLYVKPEKYKQKIRKVGFLEVVIRLEEIKMEEKKVKGVLDLQTLKRVKDLQKFLGLANYYQWFMKDFAVIARLLYNLVKKDQKWN